MLFVINVAGERTSPQGSWVLASFSGRYARKGGVVSLAPLTVARQKAGASGDSFRFFRKSVGALRHHGGWRANFSSKSVFMQGLVSQVRGACLVFPPRPNEGLMNLVRGTCMLFLPLFLHTLVLFDVSRLGFVCHANVAWR